MRPILFVAFGRPFASAPVFAGLAALAAALYFERRRADLGFSEDDFWTLMLCLMVGVFMGSVGLYFLAYGGGLAGNVDYLRRYRMVAGGSFLGTFAGATAALVVFCRLRRKPFWPVADVLAAAAPLGLIFMRIGCLLNGCCYGVPTQRAWGIVFSGQCAVRPELRGIPLHPTQLYEAVGDLAIFLLLHFAVRPRIKKGGLVAGDGLFIFAGLYGFLRFGVDFLRAGDPGIVSPLGLSLAQWAGVAAVVVAAIRFGQRKA
jgi:phosphatidylglycerol:prolipoprotein diacylglycerol transferase